jgi:hypothetical protein
MSSSDLTGGGTVLAGQSTQRFAKIAMADGTEAYVPVEAVESPPSVFDYRAFIEELRTFIERGKTMSPDLRSDESITYNTWRRGA